MTSRIRNLIRRRHEAYDSEHVARYVDESFYRERYPDVRHVDMDPRVHFVRYGLSEGRAPNRYFDPAEYCRRYNDVGLSDALIHWIRYGSEEGRIPFTLFDAHWYRSEYLAGATDAEPLLHFIEQGEASRFNPHPDFDSELYANRLFAIGRVTKHPLHHYVTAGLSGEISPNSNFDVRWYLSRYPDVQFSGVNPLHHYVEKGASENRMPNPYAAEEQASVSLRARDLKFAAHHRRILGPSDDRQGLFVGRLRPTNPVDRQPSLTVTEPGSTSFHNNVDFIAGTRIIIEPQCGILADEWFDTVSDATVTQKYRNVWPIDDGRYAIGYRLKNNTSLPAGIHMMAEADYNYFHFVTEVLTRAVCIGSTFPSLPVFVTAGLPSSYYEALRVILGAERKLIMLERSVLYYSESLYYIHDTSRLLDVYRRKAVKAEFHLSDRHITSIRQRVIDSRPIKPKSGHRRKLYLKRSSSTRRLRNETEIVSALIARDFEIIQPELFSFSDQVELFSSADTVISPTGAALTNVLWCSSSTRVIVLYSNSDNHQLDLWNLLTRPVGFEVEVLKGPRCGKINGMYEVHDDFEIDIETLIKAIQ